MPYPLGAVSVQAGKTYTVPVGASGTVGAVVVANESPYSLSASANSSGTGGQWIVAQTVDLVTCDTTAFNGTLTITTDNYLTNANSAPSFLIYLTAYAPGEPIRGTYPAALNRLTNGAIGVATQLSNDGNPAGARIIEATPGAEAQSYIIVNNDGTFNVSYKSPSLGIVQSFISGTTPDAQYGVGFQIGNGLFVFGKTTLDAGAAFPITTDNAGNVTQVGNVTSRGIVTAHAPLTLAAGNQETGYVTTYFQAAAGSVFGGSSANFKTVLTNTPTSITLSALATQNFGTVATETLSKYGFSLYINSAAAGITKWEGTYTTVGNCLLAVDTTARTIDHHCDACGHVSTAEPFANLQQITPPGGATSLAYACPACGALECFNTQLTSGDAQDTSPEGSGQYVSTRGARATLIRSLMTALGLEIQA